MKGSRRQAARLVLGGRVQGVGFRPFVFRLAREFGCEGSVCNRAGQVEVIACGLVGERLRQFSDALIDRAPPLARPELLTTETVDWIGPAGFHILDSLHSADLPDAHIPPDLFLCDDCRAEIRDVSARRYRYPFTNCTQCGPRYTIIRALPYDRPQTAMANFPLCSACRAEYESPADRRFHAQPLACPVCGPTLSFRHTAGQATLRGEAALAQTVAALREGQIIAVKGIGGYHLLCDAVNELAVARLRQRKHRPHKPLALMVPFDGTDSIAAIEALADPDPIELAALLSPERPIVLMRRRAAAPLAEAIAPHCREIGLMLPYSPLHQVLLGDFGGALVATSANLSGEPVLTDEAEVEARLATVADGFLHHDRPILRPADDAVVRVIAGEARVLRPGRGLAPIELPLPVAADRSLLATGGHLKNTIALGFRDRAVVSPHVGDLGTPRARAVFERLCREFPALYATPPERLVADAHPGYAGTVWASGQSLPLRLVAHHVAHASALAGEHRRAEPMLVFTWDGNGWGGDDTVWGGEALLGHPGNWTRVGSLRPFRLLGGDKAARSPRRCALALCWEAGLDWGTSATDEALLRQVFQTGSGSPLTTSVGRLFDAAAALLGVVLEADFEGQGPQWLEALSAQTDARVVLPLLEADGLFRLDWAPLLAMLLDARRTVAERAGCLHASLAQGLVDQAKRVRERSGVDCIGLSGGVFQNRLLSELAVDGLRAAGFEVLLHRQIPMNDGGLSYGQLVEAVALERLSVD